LAQSAGLLLGDAIAARARDQALAMLDGDVTVEVIVVDRAGEVVGRAGF
jgi:cobalt-precorrin-5B (C1)-methyltransferase